MKKAIITIVLLLGLIFCVSGQVSGPIDLVVLLDTSAGMSGFYRETSEYLVGPFLREFLRIGDTFHLISFAGAPRLEISRRIESIGDMEVIIARLLLMYPLYPQSNIGQALSFAENFSLALPGNRPARLVLISDGSAPNTQALVNSAQARLQNQGVGFQFIQIPVVGAGPPSGREPVIADLGQPPQVAPPVIPGQVAPPAQPPAELAPPQQIAPPPVIPGQVAPPPAIPGQVVPPPGVVTAPGQDVPGHAAPPAVQPPPAVIPTQPTPAQAAGPGGLPLPLLIALGILGLIILGLIVFFAARRLHDSPNRVMARAVSPVAGPRDSRPGSHAQTRTQAETHTKARTETQTQKSQERPPLAPRPAERRPLPRDKVYEDSDFMPGGPVLLNLFVEEQNRAIGMRNIHTAKTSGSFSVGGGNSDFLIFLVPIPPNIATVQFDGRNCTFIPLKPRYFPDIGSQSLHNCIGKSIRVVSDKDYELFIRVERYEDPLKVLNRLLNSISVPGPVNS